MENLDFNITEIVRIVERPNSKGWHIENMCYNEEYVMVIVLNGETEYTIHDRKYIARKNDFIPTLSH